MPWKDIINQAVRPLITMYSWWIWKRKHLCCILETWGLTCVQSLGRTNNLLRLVSIYHLTCSQELSLKLTNQFIKIHTPFDSGKTSIIMTPLPLVKEEMDVQKCMYSMYMHFSKSEIDISQYRQAWTLKKKQIHHCICTSPTLIQKTS